MPFVVPQFNILCNVWHNGGVVPPVGAPDIADLPCQLAWDRAADNPVAIAAPIRVPMKLRVPLSTDIRGPLASTGQDIVEVPAGSGRFYALMYVDDVAKAFANEYRQALMFMAQCPTPLP